MAQQNNPDIRGDDHLERLDSFIDNNFDDIEENYLPSEELQSESSQHQYYENPRNYPEEILQSESSQHQYYDYPRNYAEEIQDPTYLELAPSDYLTPRPSYETSLQRRTVSLHRKGATPNISLPKAYVEQDFDQHIKAIVEHMDKEYKEMESKTDSQEAELLRMQTLRDMPQSLAVKKRVKQTTSNRRSRKTVGMFKMMKYQIAMSWAHLKGNIKDLSYTFELWYSWLKKIEGNFGSGVASYFKFLRWLFIINLAMTILSLCFIIIPQIVLEVPTGTNFSAMDLLDGNGYLSESLLYYGSYSNGTIGGYNIPSAYFFTMPVLYIAIFILISISMASSYKKSFIMTEGGVQNIFANKIFCGWDYSIQTRNAADLKMKSIYNELMESLNDVNNTKRKLSPCDKFRLYTMQGVAHLFSIAVSLGAGYLMYTLLESDEHDDGEKSIVLAVCINIVMVVIPMIFRIIASYEDYKSPRITLFITLARTIFLELCVVAVLIYYYLKASSDTENCWENNFAKEVYRLIIFDFFFSTLFKTLIDLSWFLIHKLTDLIEAPEFDIATNTLSIIYNQTLFWVGFYFSPLLGVVIVLKLFLIFYVRSIVLLNCCQAPKKSWRAAQTQTWFLIIAFLWSLLLLFVHGFHIFSDQIKSSRNCGPLTSSDFTSLTGENLFDEILLFFIKPGVVTCILIALAFGVYYLRAVANAQIEMVEFLRYRLSLVSIDKTFLLERITEASHGFNYRKSDNQEVYMDPTIVAPRIYKSTS
ncbi:transmembrane channel-like protein 5 isoform X1 [Onthophagus taurus]|uniref:transmembrane channel-like protein 5 isoform X1 n=1 Tax=Onthophagus taurus TaxID=166361 RepID=UPI0039BEAB17